MTHVPNVPRQPVYEDPRLVALQGVIDSTHIPAPPITLPILAGQNILFSGSLVNGTDAAAHYFYALAGQTAPTITGGYAKWTVVDRPQRVGVTVLTGYDPLTMDLAIQFEALATYAPKTPTQLERDCLVLEWMGGRGTLFGEDGGIGHAGLGDSPLVRVFTSDGQGNQVPLVPLQYQTNDLAWVVSGIAWDASPLRNEQGQRVRQLATVTLTQHVGGPFSDTPDSVTSRQKTKRNVGDAFVTFHTTRAVDTIKLVAVKVAHNATHEAAVAILAANKGSRVIGTSIYKHLPTGTRVKVPRSVILQLGG